MIKLLIVCVLALSANAANYQYGTQKLSYGGYQQKPMAPPPKITPPKAPQPYQSYQQYQQQQPIIPKQVQPDFIIPQPPQPQQPSYGQYQTTAGTPPPPPPPPPMEPEPTQSYNQAPPPPPSLAPPTQNYYQPPPPSLPTPPIVPPPTQGYQSEYGQQQGGMDMSQQQGGMGLGISQPVLGGSPCDGQLPNTRIADLSDSKFFFSCSEEGKVDRMQCPNHLVFNPNTLNCETSLRLPKGCGSSPCLNGGKCVDLPFFQIRCDCQQGFAGDFCEKTDACLVDSCGPNGVCFPLPASAPVSKYCLCNGGNQFGLDCGASIETNPCLTNQADLSTFPTQANPAVYVQCEGNIPHLRFCNYPLVYSHNFQGCDWTAVSPAPVPAPLPTLKPVQIPQVRQPLSRPPQQQFKPMTQQRTGGY